MTKIYFDGFNKSSTPIKMKAIKGEKMTNRINSVSFTGNMARAYLQKKAAQQAKIAAENTKDANESTDGDDDARNDSDDDDFTPSIDVDRLPSANETSSMISNSLATLYDDIKCELGCGDETTMHHMRNVIDIAFDGISDDMLMAIAEDQSVIFDDIAVSYSMPPEYVIMTPSSTDDATDIEPCKRYVVELGGDCLTRNTCRLTATTGEVQLEYATERDIIDFV